MKQLKRFCLSFFLFAVFILSAAYGFNIFLGDYCKAYFPYFASSEIYMSILKSKKKTTIKKLLLGDSTAHQFFNNTNPDIDYYSLACNQSIGLCGHFFLLNNFLNAGNRPEEVYILLTPGSLKNNLDKIYTYHYFLKPFNRSEYKPLMTENVVRQMSKIPYHQFSQFPLTLSPAYVPDYHAQEQKIQFLSPISIEYLEKIDSLQKIYDFRVYYVPTLVSESFEEEIKEFKIAGVNDTLKNALTLYINSIHYLPSECFIDNVHMMQPLKYKNVILEEMEYVKTKLDSIR